MPAVREFLIVAWMIRGAVLYQHELRCAPWHRRFYDASRVGITPID
jgi:hypothetical protein